jgi:hypothetical protein
VTVEPTGSTARQARALLLGRQLSDDLREPKPSRTDRSEKAKATLSESSQSSVEAVFVEGGRDQSRCRVQDRASEVHDRSLAMDHDSSVRSHDARLCCPHAVNDRRRGLGSRSLTREARTAVGDQIRQSQCFRAELLDELDAVTAKALTFDPLLGSERRSAANETSEDDGHTLVHLGSSSRIALGGPADETDRGRGPRITILRRTPGDPCWETRPCIVRCSVFRTLPPLGLAV